MSKSKKHKTLNRRVMTASGAKALRRYERLRLESALVVQSALTQLSSDQSDEDVLSRAPSHKERKRIPERRCVWQVFFGLPEQESGCTPCRVIVRELPSLRLVAEKCHTFDGDEHPLHWLLDLTGDLPKPQVLMLDHDPSVVDILKGCAWLLSCELYRADSECIKPARECGYVERGVAVRAETRRKRTSRHDHLVNTVSAAAT